MERRGFFPIIETASLFSWSGLTRQKLQPSALHQHTEPDYIEMSNRHVFSGHNAQDQAAWVAMELQLREKEVLFQLVPKEGLAPEAAKKLQEAWVSGADFEWPEGTETLRHSAEAESILPDSVKADQPEMLRRVQNEWTLKLLSFKLYESINDEVTNLQAATQEAVGYSQEAWDKAKKLWDQVGNHSQDFNLSKKHTGELRDRINGLFTELKKRREEGQDQLAEASAALKVKYEESLKGIQSAMAEGNAKVNQLFDKLKGLQKEIKEASLTHRDRRKLWKELDGAFNTLKAEKQHLYHSHLSNRIAGLQKAIDRMQSSIDHDRKQIDWEAKKLETGRIGQLEHQLRQTRLKVVEDRIKSKEEKLSDMHRTMQNLQKKEAQQRKAEEKARKKAEEAAAAAEAAKAPAGDTGASPEDAASDEAAADSAPNEIPAETPVATPADAPSGTRTDAPPRVAGQIHDESPEQIPAEGTASEETVVPPQIPPADVLSEATAVTEASEDAPKAEAAAEEAPKAEAPQAKAPEHEVPAEEEPGKAAPASEPSKPEGGEDAGDQKTGKA
jgi:uncharacterized coiled-coil DUF342 family protein